MKKLFFTTIFLLAATFSMAQWITEFPITLTTADGLPGEKLVNSYLYRSETFDLEEPVSVLRFTVCSTHNIDTLTTGSYTGFSAGWGSGIPFFALSEFRIYDGRGEEIDYIASSNAVQHCDCGGLYSLSDKRESTHFQSTYNNSGDFPHAWHYIEFKLPKPVDSFSFAWNSRSNTNGEDGMSPTYVGITPGTDYQPFPEQEFTLGEQVTSLDELSDEGALFVLRSNAPKDFYYDPEGSNRRVPRHLFYHAPYGGTETASSAALVYLTPDAENPNAYKVCWLNNGHYIIDSNYQSDTEAPFNIWLHWTNNVLKAASVEFAPCDTVACDFVLTQHDGAYTLATDGLGKMRICDDPVASIAEASRPYTFHMSVYKASINGAAIAAQLQAEIDEAEARIEAIGGKVPVYDEGEYEALEAAVAEAKEIVAKADVTAAEILNTKRSLNRLTAAYAAVGLWVYVDSIAVIGEMVDNEEITLCQGPDWENGAYNQAAFDAMQVLSDNIQLVIEKCESLADVDAAIEDIYAAIANFWASKVTGVKELPFRVGSLEDGLPGKNVNSIWIWESPMYLLSEETDAIRFTVFKNHSGRSVGDKPFLCINEMQFYDEAGNLIPLTADNFSSNSVHPTDGAGLAGLCDGDWKLDNGTHYHSWWGTNDEYDGTEYVWIEVVFPEPIIAFKYVQYGRGDGYDDVPVDIAFGHAGQTLTPDDVSLSDNHNVALGDKIADLSQITDDGLYALVGLGNCAPEGDGSGHEKFYTSTAAYGSKIGAPCAYAISRTGDDDGTFYIRSLADGSYWSSAIDADGWCDVSVTYKKSQAGKFHIVPNAAARAEAGAQEYPGTFAIYMYNDTVTRVNEKVDAKNATAHPYIVVQDCGTRAGCYSLPTLAMNDLDGRGEWAICKMTMDNPSLYMLAPLYAAATAMDIRIDESPGFYSDAAAKDFVSALAYARSAIDTKNETMAQKAIAAIDAGIVGLDTAELNPLIPGHYIIEAASGIFYEYQGVKKAMCAYYTGSQYNIHDCTNEYDLLWADAPEEYYNASYYYRFELIPARSSAKVQAWLENGTITADDAARAFFIKSMLIGQYVGFCSDDTLSQEVGFTSEPEPFIIRPHGAYKFDFWHPLAANTSLHMYGHAAGQGKSGYVGFYEGANDFSQWSLINVSPKRAYFIFYDLVPNGVIRLSAAAVGYGGSVTVELIPNDNYTIGALYVDGRDVTDKIVDGKYVIENITHNVTLEATFTTGIGGAVADEVVSRKYFTEAGIAVDKPREGVNIVVVKYASGRVETKKVFVRKK
ncbi:MAG: hypothetical protein IKU50_02715 [Bacteroidaceae bacterium]|nr:hypothetical protein [Bacteroidaceae bacterium]